MSAMGSAEILAKITEDIRAWPDMPGVYIMKDANQRILYVGKAKSLRNRIRAYFTSVGQLSPKNQVMVKKILTVEYIVTNTEIEALLLECNLIKKHRPRYNISLKDDKNFPYIVLDFTPKFPQFRTTRRVLSLPGLRHFGPYVGSVRDLSRFLLKTFQLRDCSEAKFNNRKRPCLNYEIGTCTAPCVNYVSEEDYAKQVQEAVLFLKGRKKELVAKLKKEMQEASDAQSYEQAKVFRDRITDIQSHLAKQSAVLVDNQSDLDIVGYFTDGKEIMWVVLFIRGRFLVGRRSEKTIIPAGDESPLRSFLEQFYSVSIIPDEVWVSEDFESKNVLQDFLSKQAGKKVEVKVKRGERSIRLLGMASENAKLLWEESKRKDKTSPTEELKEVLGLSEAPFTIEGIDVSNFQGKSPAVALVHFANEAPLKSRYRLYYPETVEGQDDFAMIYETVKRRFSKPEPPFPDLLLIDGGKGQLQSAVRALEELDVHIPVLALAKARTESAFTLKEVSKSEERVFIPGRKNPLNLKEGSPALGLLVRVRDEAHRFSVKSHQRRRSKWTNEGSPWDVIPGIGEKTKMKLMKTFGSWENFLQAPEDAWRDAGLNKTQIATLLSKKQIND